jgi:Brp/Blh family beta-carotene 15,15'-monooxygenase
MNNGTKLVASLALVLSLSALVSPTYSEWLALGLMVCAGIPHGAFDLRVAEAKWRGLGAPRSLILLGYVVSVIIMCAVCVFLPLIGLSLFLVISVAHFVEGEAPAGESGLSYRSILYGIGAIWLPIGLHSSVARHYVSYFIPESIFSIIEPWAALGAAVIVLLMCVDLTRTVITGSKIASPDTSQRLICLCAWLILSPLAGFAVWFIGRHSRQHLETCKAKLSTGETGIPLDFAVISLLAVAGLAPFALLFDFSDINQVFAASICLIAGLTLPHMIVSHGIESVSLRQLS